MKVTDEPAVAVRTEHDQAGVARLGGLDDPSPNRSGFNHKALRTESRRRGKRSAVFGGLLRGPSDFVCRIGVEVALIRRLEANIGGLPDTYDESVAVSRDLSSGLFNSYAREFRAVVGKEHRTGGCRRAVVNPYHLSYRFQLVRPPWPGSYLRDFLARFGELSPVVVANPTRDLDQRGRGRDQGSGDAHH
jgi:hypothetical protein